ncbi:MAG TPA: hypothetical protein VGT79_02885 [Xanthomonadaceae bacterium]|nr:hypothetical protein [Xanthomonadaceae bacterium]
MLRLDSYPQAESIRQKLGIVQRRGSAPKARVQDRAAVVTVLIRNGF